ncbi:MAG TPA: hypothetical protein VN738_05140 [Acidothermaceae bacterium]|nr:hypothetical protein [Acidothermaceae bacterium]
MTETTEAIPPGLCQCGCGGKTKLARQNTPTAAKGQPNAYLHGHSRGCRKRNRPLPDTLRGKPRPPASSVIHPSCPTPECGEPNPVEFRPPGWVFVLVAGSREPGRWFCCGQCATFGMAIAELRPAAEVAS